MPTRFNHLQLKLLIPLVVVLLAVNTLFAQQTDTTKRCGSEVSHEQLMNSSNQGFRTRYRELDKFTKDYIQNLTILSRDSGIADDRSSVITIPVVVHIVSSPGMPFISDAQVNSQIDALNRDFRKLNADAATIPGAFAPLAADCHIEFRLAVRGPGCVPTTGITRTSTSLTGFATPTTESEYHELAHNPVKSTMAGGHDAWSSEKYLNIWVCNFLRSGLLGYSSFPTDPPIVDGVAMSYRAFGTIGTVAAPYNLGRVTVHEVGHWLNVFHIWGDDGTACTGSDEVDDTPNQAGPNFGCPSFPHVTCGNIPNGDMFINYMDYVNDACKTMFTIGQSQRMDATLLRFRFLLLSSDALTPVSAPGDLYMQDYSNYLIAPGVYVTDNGTEPSGSTVIQDMAHSQDIWIRNRPEAIRIEEHQNAVYRPASSLLPNYVYVKVRNRGCTGASLSGNLKLYWSHTSTGSLVWPEAWNGSNPRQGGPIGTPTPVTVAPGGSTIIRFEWYPPNPADYPFPNPYDSKHFCLLARIETSTTPPYGMSYPEINGDINALWYNVNRNNNIVWKNIAVENEATGLGTATTLVAGNSGNNVIMSKFYFKTVENIHQQHLLKYGNVIIKLGTDLYNKWKLGGKKSSGLIELADSSLLIRNKNAWIDSLKFGPKEIYGMRVNFQYAKKIPFGDARSLEFKVEQTAYDSVGQEKNVGTETYHIKSLNLDRNNLVREVRAKFRAVLEGAYRADIAMMLESLRIRGVIPIVTPYHSPQFKPVNNPVLEVIDSAVLQVSGPQAITDWIWIELRDSLDSKKVLSTRSALIRRDGAIVDLDGVSPVSFRNLPDGGYYIVLRHRNHLGIMTAGTTHLNAKDTASIDFTKPTTLTYGNKAQKIIGNIMAMWAGNANGDGTIKYNGASNDKVFILSKIGLATPNNVLVRYDAADTNLDGLIKYNGAANDKNVILANVGLNTPNNVIVQQLP